MLFQMLGVFAEFERAIITSRIVAGQARAKSKGVKFGRPPVAPIRIDKVRKALAEGKSIRAVAKSTGVSTATVMRTKRSMQTVDQDRDETIATA
jgi:DNA invertase Pin-like site-specific DNA recombinase